MAIEVILDEVKRKITKHQLFALAAHGRIGPETIIYVDGKNHLAKNIKGITFANFQNTKTTDKPNEHVPFLQKANNLSDAFNEAVSNLMSPQPQTIAPPAKHEPLSTHTQSVSVGVSTSKPVSKNRLIAALLAFCFGGIGVHKYYLGDVKGGLVFTIAVVCTFGIASVVTSILAWCDAIRFLLMSDKDFASQYSSQTEPRSNTVNTADTQTISQTSNSVRATPTFRCACLGQCPSCKKYWAKELTKQTHIGSHTHTYTAHEVINETRNRRGEIIARTTRPVNRSKVVTTHKCEFKCKYCGHEWWWIT